MVKLNFVNEIIFILLKLNNINTSKIIFVKK